jgi:hypothetical protein
MLTKAVSYCTCNIRYEINEINETRTVSDLTEWYPPLAILRKCCNPHIYWWNRIGFKQSHFVEDLVATPRCMFLVSLFWRWDVVSMLTKAVSYCTCNIRYEINETRTVSDLTEWYPPLAILWCSNFGIQVY